MILMEIDFDSKVIYDTSSCSPIMAPDENHVVIFIKPKNYLRLKDFPKDTLEYEKKLQLNFHLAISVINEEKYIEYCREMNNGFLNFLNFFKRKTDPYVTSKYKDYYKVYAPIVFAAYNEVKEYIEDNFEPKFSFSGHIIPKLEELKKVANDENVLMIPIFLDDLYLIK